MSQQGKGAAGGGRGRGRGRGKGHGNQPSAETATGQPPGQQAEMNPIATSALLDSSNLDDKEKALKPISRPVDSKTGQFLYCTLGRAVKTIVTNHFVMNIDPNNSAQIFRYDVEILPSRINKVKKRQVMQAAWKNASLNFGLPKMAETTCKKPVVAYGYDGNKILYSVAAIDFPKIAKVRIPRERDQTDEEFTIEIRKHTGTFALSDLLRDDIAGTDEILAGLDIILLTNPKVNYPTNRKRYFYYPLAQPFPLRDGFKEIWSGFYSSARQGEWKLLLNVDVTAAVVIEPLPLWKVFDENCGGDLRKMNQQLRKLKQGLKIDVKFDNFHKKLVFQAVVPKYPKLHKFQDFKDPKKTWILDQFYREIKRVTIEYPNYPLVQVKNGKNVEELYPMEFCTIAEGQLVVTKRQSKEQAELLSYISKKVGPAERFRRTVDDFEHKFATPEQVAILRQFGITVEKKPLQIREARVLPPVQIRAGDAAPIQVGQNDRHEPGKFELGNRFYQSPENIGRWAVVETTGQLSRADINEWIKLFFQGLQRKKIGTTNPEAIIERATTKEAVKNCFVTLTKKGIAFIVFFVEKSTNEAWQYPNAVEKLYPYIKQLGDRQFRIATQCVDIGKWKKMNNEYMNNLVLKVNVKLGGVNFILSDSTFKNQNVTPPMFDEPVLLMGADVTHAGPDEKTKPSIAAVIGSIDRHATKYTQVITSQSRTFLPGQNSTQEWISNFGETTKKLLLAYIRNSGEKPKKIIVYRDGVSYGQFSTVLHKELREIQKACQELEDGYQPAITYLLAMKRIKEKVYNKDSKGNIVNVDPGTIVETDITQPKRLFDFYLVPHHSPLGTAKPTHYCILWDDSNFSPDQIEYLTFALCHLLPRCTKAVSIPAPVYRAHLAADRASHHLAGDPFDPLAVGGQQEERKRLELEHTRKATDMDPETSNAPNDYYM